MKKYAGSLLLAGLLFTVPGRAAEDLEQFVVDSDAACPADGLAAKPGFAKSGSSFIIASTAPLYRGAAATAPEANRKVPPLTRVVCFGAVGVGKRYRVLVSADVANAKGGTDALCGWLDPTTLLQQSAMSAGTPCPDVKERKVSDYVAEGPKHHSPLNLKLIVWNINLDPAAVRTQTGKAARPVIPAYATPGGEKARDVNIYSVFPVYDFQVQGNDTYFLIGANDGLLLGWVREKDAAVWDNRLTLFFKEGKPNANIYYSLKDLTEAAKSGAARPALATPPKNLADTLRNTRNSFPKFPVLDDHSDATVHRLPYYQIAFIGNWCAEGTDCSNLNLSVANERVEVGDKLRELEQVDILFVIDATESMSPYFKAVAEAVKAATQKYRGDNRIRIGAALYGDYTSSVKAPGGPLQYGDNKGGLTVPLTAIINGDEMDALASQATFRDPNRDTPEASDGALLKAASSGDWRKTGRHLIVHIGDHGPRQDTASDSVLKALREQRVFYLPIAVAGSFSQANNKAFVTAAQNLLDAYKTPKGNPMGLPQVLVTYDPTSGSQDLDKTRVSVRSVLDKGLAQAEQVSLAIMNEIYALDGQSPAPTAAPPAGGSDKVAAGFAQLTPALREVFGLEEDKIALIKSQGQLVSPGHVAKFDPRDKKSDQWDYFVAVDPEQMPLLESTIGSLCLAVSRSSAKDKLVSSIQTMTQSLSGDRIPDTQSLYDYLENVLQIPLSNETWLRKPIKELQTQVGNATAEELGAFKKKVCRSAVLLKLVRESRKIDPDKDLLWSEKEQEWTYKDSISFGWTYAPESGSEFIYVPLRYFPE